MNVKIAPIKSIKGEINVPGDKSISHRALLLGALAEGQTQISGFLPGEDCLNTAKCLQQMGVEIEFKNPTQVIMQGVGLKGLKEPSQVLDAGNSGTTARLLLGILAGQKFFSTLTGDSSLRSRPMGRVVKPLTKMGAEIWGRNDANLLPLALKGGKLRGISYKTPVASAQLKSAILLAGLFADGPTTVVEPEKSRDHTERMLTYFGADVRVDQLKVTLTPGQKLYGGNIAVPGDISSAAFFMVAASILPNSQLVIKNVGVNPTRTGIITALKQMNAQIQITNERTVAGEPVADVVVKSSTLKGTVIKGELIPKLIDEIPILAVAALYAQGETYILDAQELRVKESDRLKALALELKKIGGQVQELPDGLHIKGDHSVSGGQCFSHYDHRIAMALAIAGLKSQNGVNISEFSCVSISYPNFMDDLKAVSIG